MTAPLNVKRCDRRSRDGLIPARPAVVTLPTHYTRHLASAPPFLRLMSTAAANATPLQTM